MKRFHAISRRDALRGLGAAWAMSVASWCGAVAQLRFSTSPFTLGVASGYPTSTGIVLWTRLLHAALENTAVEVQWELARDERMRRIVRRGREVATPEWAHSLHVEVEGLEPGREYWYRFTAGGQQSTIGRTRTAPALAALPNRVRFAVASCQKYENGYYTAYRHMLDDDLDLVIHVGDYIYEYASSGGMRSDGSGETQTLADYRARYALYKSDPNLQAVHAAHPWLVTWDDHEVINDYAGDTSYDMRGDVLLARRAAAYRAYYEHMPLPRTAIPEGPNMLLYASRRFGNLLAVHMLDSRQYRSPLACLGDEDSGGLGASCKSLFDAERTKLGRSQEAWFKDTLIANRNTRWHVIAQGTPMAHIDYDPSPAVAYRRDSWDGYPAARQRVLDALVETRASNPIIIDGDIHAFEVANIHHQANDLTTPIVASEFTTTSITSGGIAQRGLEERMKINPNILLGHSGRRGYLLMELSPSQSKADLVTVDTISQPESPRGLLARFHVEAGKPGPLAEVTPAGTTGPSYR